MASISIAIIAHNEEKNVPRCLADTAWADEVIFVDCGSSDATAKAASAFRVKLFSRPNSTAVYVNKQFAADQAASDWILILDADEDISPELREEIKEVTARPGAAAAYAMPRRNFYFGRWLKHGGKYPDVQLRLFRRGKARFAQVPVHEYLQVDGPTELLKNPLDHYPYSDPEDMRRKLEFYSDILVKSYVLKKKNRLLILLRPFTRFCSAYIFKLGFLDGREGWTTAAMDFRNVLASAFTYFRSGGAKGPRRI